MEKSKVLLRAAPPELIPMAVRECLQQFDWQSWVEPDASVVIKPNLCTAMSKVITGGNTNRAVVRAACEVLLTRTRRISIAEAAHFRQSTYEAFQASGFVELAKELGVELVDLTKSPSIKIDCPPAGPISMPRLLVEAQAYVNIPVLKTHALTYFTGALKNQWGCLPEARDRMRFHRFINTMLSSLQKILKPKLCIMDGTYGMEGRGPVAGRVRRLDVILASPDPVALDSTSMRLVGLLPDRARHVVVAAEQGLGRMKPEEIEIDGDWHRFQTKFQPAPRDIANRAMFEASRFDWFVKYVYTNDALYKPVRNAVKFFRRVGLFGG